MRDDHSGKTGRTRLSTRLIVALIGAVCGAAAGLGLLYGIVGDWGPTPWGYWAGGGALVGFVLTFIFGERVIGWIGAVFEEMPR